MTYPDFERLRQFASHDIKPPIRGVKALSGFLREDLAETLTPRQEMFLDQLENCGSQLEKMSDALARYFRLHAFVPKPEPLDLGTMIHEAAASHSFTGSLEADPLPTVTGDRIAAEAVIRELLSNACQHGSTDIQVSITAAGPRQIRVADNGPGIPEHLADTACQLFAKGPQSQGVGVGLTEVSLLMQLQGGSLEITQAAGTGTEVLLSWPD